MHVAEIERLNSKMKSQLSELKDANEKIESSNAQVSPFMSR